MPDKRTHRGPHPSDSKLFSADKVPVLRAAVGDYSLLLSKGYADKSALKLVGDRFSLIKRQRLAVMRSSCSDRHLTSRNQSRININDLKDKSIAIDGYNLLITIEAAMSGAVIFKGRGGCFRDLASIHSTYRRVAETIPAVELIGTFLKEVNPRRVLWLLDSPVSNSGRLKTLISEMAVKNNWNWGVKLAISPDKELKETDSVVVTTDSVILDSCSQWTNLAAEIITERIKDAWIVDLSN
ncbi:DUF434 domain-containing protein [Planctomycetota bacterium]